MIDMNKTFARIVDGVVINVEIWGEDPPAAPGVTFVESDTAAQGDLWNGQTFTRPEAPVQRRLLPKSTVTSRLIEMGKAAAVKAAMDANPVAWARWFTPDWPDVYADDDGLLAFLVAIGLTEGQIATVTA